MMNEPHYVKHIGRSNQRCRPKRLSLRWRSVAGLPQTSTFSRVPAMDAASMNQPSSSRTSR